MKGSYNNLSISTAAVGISGMGVAFGLKGVELNCGGYKNEWHLFKNSHQLIRTKKMIADMQTVDTLRLRVQLIGMEIQDLHVKL